VIIRGLVTGGGSLAHWGAVGVRVLALTGAGVASCGSDAHRGRTGQTVSTLRFSSRRAGADHVSTGGTSGAGGATSSSIRTRSTLGT
jgi:hypothetical protein